MVEKFRIQLVQKLQHRYFINSDATGMRGYLYYKLLKVYNVQLVRMKV